MSTIKHNALWQVKYHSEELKNARRARKLLKLLPPEIQELQGRFIHSYGDRFNLEINGEAAFETAFDHGVVFENEYHFSGEYGTNIEDCKDFKVYGRLPWPDLTITVEAGHLPKPETCEVEAVTEMVTRYVAKCQETGKEL